MMKKGNMLVGLGVGTITPFLDEAIHSELERARVE